MAAARRQDQEPTAPLAQRDLFGDLADQPRFLAACTTALQHLEREGARARLERHLDEQR